MNRVNLFITLICILAISCQQKNTTESQAEEWIQLFNRKDLAGWEIKLAKHPLNENFRNTFIVEDSLLKVNYRDYTRFDDEFGHIYYKDPFSYYKIRVEYRFTGQQLEGGPYYGLLNSGIMLHSQSAASNTIDQSFPVSLELQLLAGDEKEARTTGNLCTPGTQVYMKGGLLPTHCVNATSKSYPANVWVTAEAVVLGDSVIHHIINGDTVLTYEHPQIGGGFVNNELTWTNGGFGADSVSWIQQQGTPLRSGYIALQAESQPLEFRKVELLNLVGCMDKSAINYKPYYIKAENSKCRYK